jgi:hypothetical protein
VYFGINILKFFIIVWHGWYCTWGRAHLPAQPREAQILQMLCWESVLFQMLQEHCGPNQRALTSHRLSGCDHLPPRIHPTTLWILSGAVIGIELGETFFKNIERGARDVQRILFSSFLTWIYASVFLSALCLCVTLHACQHGNNADFATSVSSCCKSVSFL